jgi:hypothetical protein
LTQKRTPGIALRRASGILASHSSQCVRLSASGNLLFANWTAGLGESAVDAKILPCHPSCLLADQKQNYPGNVVWFTNAAKFSHRSKTLNVVLTFTFIEQFRVYKLPPLGNDSA